MSDNYARDPDALYDETKVAVLEIAVRRNGSLSVIGCIDNLDFALKMCDEAKDAIRRHHARQVKIIVPHNATDLRV